jgi:hypothetical protein
MSWAEVKKINSNLDKPLDTLLDEVVGDNTDPADANGSVHGKIKEFRNTVSTTLDTVSTTLDTVAVRYVIPSDTVRIAADTERILTTGTSQPFTLRKSIRVFCIGKVRVTWDGAVRGSYKYILGRVDIKKPDGTIIEGIEQRCENTTSYVTFTNDLVVESGDELCLMLKLNTNASTTTFKWRNFRVYWDYATASGIVTKDVLE